MKLIGASIYSFTDHLFTDLRELGLNLSAVQKSSKDGEVHHLLFGLGDQCLDYITVEQDEDFLRQHGREGENALCPRLYVDFDCTIPWMVNVKAVASSTVAGFEIIGAYLNLEDAEKAEIFQSLKCSPTGIAKVNETQNIWLADVGDSHYHSFQHKKKFPLLAIVLKISEFKGTDYPTIKIGTDSFYWIAQNSIGWDLLIPV